MRNNNGQFWSMVAHVTLLKNSVLSFVSQPSLEHGGPRRIASFLNLGKDHVT